MTGRTAAIKRPHSPAKTGSKKLSPSSKHKSTPSLPLDLRDVLNSARKAFEGGLDLNVSSSLRTRSTVCSPRIGTRSSSKSSSAPVSPSKSMNSKTTMNSSLPLVNKRPRLDLTPKVKKANLLLKEVLKNNDENESKSPDNSPDPPGKKITLLSSNLRQKKGKNGGSMNEVIKLHQDEGVMHLLHGLPSSRRKTNALTSTNVSVARRISSADVPPPSTVISSDGDGVRKSIQRVKLIQQTSRQHNKGWRTQKSQEPVKPCTQEDLMSSKTLELLKQLPTKEYVRLWSSPTRYVLKNAKKEESENGPVIEAFSRFPERQSASPASEVSGVSDMSSVSTKFTSNGISGHPEGRKKPWNLNTKHMKDLLVRTYPTFAQIMISPVSTGFRYTINVNVIEELLDLLGQCAKDDECKAVMISGIGGTFSLGVDLSILSFEATEKQRKSAESLANSIKKLVKYLLNYPKLLFAGVNGHARGLGVTILPLFDVVFASDKATFGVDYSMLGQIPEAFGGHTIFENPTTASKMLVFAKRISAEEAFNFQIVSDVVWPDKFLEEIVPRIEELNEMPSFGLEVMKRSTSRSKKRKLTQEIVDEETKELIKCWTNPKFVKTLRKYLKSNPYLYQ